MYRALYEYKTDIGSYLSFQKGDQFTILEKGHKDWFLAQNGFGEIGFIPTNYIVSDNVSQNEVLRSIDRAIEVIHYEASSKGGQYTHTQRENLKKLIEHRKNVVQSATPIENNHEVSQQPNSVSDQARKKSSVRCAAPRPPSGDPSSSQPVNKVQAARMESSQKVQSPTTPTNTQPPATNLNNIKSIKTQTAPLDVRSSYSQTDTEDAASKVDHSHGVDLSSVEVPSGLGSELLEQIRQNTGLSYKLSGVALETVFGCVGLRVPELADILDRIYCTVHETGDDAAEEETSSDYERLQKIFTELMACKDDSQQRGWALQEDEEIISNNLEELASILENAKQSVTKKAIAVDNYEFVYHLVQYYQLETRVKLRLLLLRVFGAMCTLDSAVITLLLFSSLTTELTQELEQSTDDVQQVSYVSLVLTMLFAMGEPVPANLHDHLNKSFLHFVFDTIENPPESDEEDQIPEMLIHFMLAFNLHFHEPSDNLVMQVIAEKQTAKVFTEKILLYFNRGEDPVKMFEHVPQPPHSVMKLLQDLYSNQNTASVIYVNDVKVLIDIILGHLTDLSPGDKIRTSHLRLMKLYLQNSDYMEHQHRFTELSGCLRRIQGEEEECPEDKEIVNYILSQIPVFIVPE